MEWKFEGKGEVAKSVLPEDPMVPDGYEARLMRFDPAVAEKVLFSNHGWSWWKRDAELVRHGHTL